MPHTSETLQQAFGYLFPNEVQALKELARSLPDDPFVINIGAGAGTSGLAFLESRSDLFMTTVDIQKDDSPFGCLEAERKLVEENYGKTTRLNQRHQDSKDFAKDFALMRERYNASLDMVFIDGDHTYEGCKGDILAWIPNIKSGGIIAVHDYDKVEVYNELPEYGDERDVKKPHPRPWPGVDKAVNELLIGKYEEVLRVDTLIAFRV